VFLLNSRVARAVLACATILLMAAPVAAAAPPSIAAGSIEGSVHDATTGATLSGVEIHVIGSTVSTKTDAEGRFFLPPLAPGRYRLTLRRQGYQPAVSEPIAIGATVVVATLAMQEGANGLQVIAVTSARSSDSLQQSSTFTKTLNPELLQQQGIVRAGDALRTEPGVNNGIAGDTAALSDDLQLDIRGIGTLETQAAIDGHPIAYGIPGGFNYQLSPVYPYRDISVLYGSGGSDLLGVNAIGGVINFQTLDPTPHDTASFTQGYGTFQQLSSGLTSTGTSGHLGYALALGVSSLDGPFRNATFYQPGAAFDQSVLSGPVHDLGIYEDDSLETTRAILAKLVYSFDAASSLTFTSVSENRWVNKTGNGDGDFLPYAPALAFGEQLLAAYSPSSWPNLPACPKGTFVATNANGQPNGFGPNGKPDGGITCQTPQQYAAFNTGWDGAGPAWQSLKLNDNSMDYRYQTGNSVIRVGLFNSFYENLIDRTFFLPNLAPPISPFYPGNSGFWYNIAVNETGAIVSDDLLGRQNDFEFGADYMNSAYYTYINNGLIGAPVISDNAYFLRDVYHPGNSPISAYANVWAKHSTATNTSYVDSRLSVVDRVTPHDQVRASAGSTTTQPSGDMLGQSFAEEPNFGAGGGPPITCEALNSIGSAPSTLLKPEDGVDQDLAYVHRWQGDTFAQLEVYNTNVYDKLYQTIEPLSQTGTSFIPADYLARVTAAVAAKCGAPAAPGLLGLTGNFNIGTLRAQGADLSGRVRVSRQFYINYDWALTSTLLLGASEPLLESNLTLVLNDQLPRLPLHTFNGSADYTFGDGLDARYTLYTVSVNNTKSLPAYDYSDLSLSYPLGHGLLLSGTVLNLFNQWATIAGMRYEGVPLPLNNYATPASYAQYTGANATEQFGLPFRTVYFSVQATLPGGAL
jgi:outer membrane receptor protein involved in Fe transport